ncbi:MAG TPA: hypothetical protein VIT65_02470 [Microlunatus sp.]
MKFWLRSTGLAPRRRRWGCAKRKSRSPGTKVQRKNFLGETVHPTEESVSGGVKAALTQAYRQAMNQTWMIPVILVIVALLLVFALIGIFS